MGILIQPKRWAMKPPVGTQINRGHPLAQGLVGCWLISEGGGLVLTDSLHRTSGTLTGAALPTWSNGPMGSALNFNGSSSYVTFSSFANLTGLTGSMSLATIINPSNVTVLGAIVSPYGAPTAFDIEVGRVSGKISFLHGMNPYFQANGNTTLAVGTWYHVAAVRTGSSGSWTVTLYLNGIQDSVTTGSIDPGSLTSLSFGRAGNLSSAYYSGYLGNVMLWSRPLSASEVQWLYIEPYAFMQSPRPLVPVQVPPAEGYIFHYHR